MRLCIPHILLSIALLCCAISAQTPESRIWSLQSASPLRDFDATAHAYLSFQQSIGFADDAVNAKWNPAAHWPGRSMETFAVTYLNLALGYYTHEIGHDIGSPLFGDGKQWVGWPTDPSYMPWPQYYSSNEYNNCSYWCSAYDSLWDIGIYSGLNMEEYSAQLLAQSAHDYLSWDEGLAYVSRRISPVTYEAISPAGFWPRKNAQGRWTFGLKSDAGDPEQYLISERTQGRSISYGDFYLRSLGPILLTWRVHESIATVWGYLREGSRGRTPFAWQGHGIIVQPPLVSGYILAHGTLWDAAFLWKRAGTGNWHRVTLGTDADWIGSGDLAKLHLAFENPLFKLALPWGKQHASASLAQSFTWRKKPFDWIGYEVRSDLRIGLVQHADLQLSFANSHNDIIAHDVMLQQNGYRVSAGLNGSFP